MGTEKGTVPAGLNSPQHCLTQRRPCTPAVSPNWPEHPSTLQCPQTEAELRAGTCRDRSQQGQGPLQCPQARTGATTRAKIILLHSVPTCGFARQKPGKGRRESGP